MRNTDMVPVILLNSLSPCFWGRASGKFPLVLSSTVFPNIKLLISLAFWSGAGQLWASSGFYPEPKPHALGLVCSPPPPNLIGTPSTLVLSPDSALGPAGGSCWSPIFWAWFRPSPSAHFHAGNHWWRTHGLLSTTADDCWRPQAHFCGHLVSVNTYVR